MSNNERLATLRSQERKLVSSLTGPSRGMDRPAMSKQLASIRRQIAMLTEDDRAPMEMPEQSRRFR